MVRQMPAPLARAISISPPHSPTPPSSRCLRERYAGVAPRGFAYPRFRGTVCFQPLLTGKFRYNAPVSSPKIGGGGGGFRTYSEGWDNALLAGREMGLTGYLM